MKIWPPCAILIAHADAVIPAVLILVWVLIFIHTLCMQAENGSGKRVSTLTSLINSIKGLTSWLSFVVSNCEFVTFPLVSWVRCGTWLYWFLILHPYLLWLSVVLSVLRGGPKKSPRTFIYALIIPILSIVCAIIATDCMLGGQPNHGWQVCFPF